MVGLSDGKNNKTWEI